MRPSEIDDIINKCKRKEKQAVLAGVKKAIYLKEIPKKLIEGMTLLNRNKGATSLIFLKPDKENVRVFTRDSIKYEWVTQSWGLKLGEYVDTIETTMYSYKFDGEPIYVFDMPVLYPLSPENKKLVNKILKLFNDIQRKSRFDSYKILNNIWDLYNQYDEDEVPIEIEYLNTLANFLSNYPDMYNFDISLRNFMQDSYGELIMLDPVVSRKVIELLRR